MFIGFLPFLVPLALKVLSSTLVKLGVTYVAATAAGNLTESFCDNVFRERVRPRVGSVVFCSMAAGNAEHSGICVGDDEIVHLGGSGRVELVTPEEFISGVLAISIYVSCDDTRAVGSALAAERARRRVGDRVDYNLLLKNCHIFTSGCLTGDFGNADSFMWMLKQTSEKHLGANTWRVWERG